MAYTPPVTFTDATPTTAADVRANLIAAKKYVDGSIVAGDISSATAWAERKHLMRPEYVPVVNRLELITGVSGGQTRLGSMQLGTYVSFCNSDKMLSGTAGVVQEVPSVAYDFVLDDKADVRFSFEGYPLAQNDDSAVAIVGGQGSAWVELYLDDGTTGEVRYASSRSYTLEEVTGLTPEDDRHIWYCYTVILSLPAGTHHIRLSGAASCLRCVMFAFSFTLQAYYILKP